jgi:hypothetical protein
MNGFENRQVPRSRHIASFNRPTVIKYAKQQNGQHDPKFFVRFGRDRPLLPGDKLNSQFQINSFVASLVVFIFKAKPRQ